MQAMLALFFVVAASGGQSPDRQIATDAGGPLVRCEVLPFRGAARPEGATATMIVVSDGRPCGMMNAGRAAERRNPPNAAVVTLAPKHGKVEFIAPRVEYTAEAGYAGDDEFAYEATASDAAGASLVLRVRVKVDVRRARFARAPAAVAPPPIAPMLPIAVASPERSINPDFEKGLQSLERRQYEEALKSFRRANEVNAKNCAECSYGMARAYEGLGASKNVVEHCDRAIELGANDTRLLVLARQTKGLALQALAAVKDLKKLQGAEAEFRAALVLDPDAAFLHFNLGVVLMQQRRDAEGVEELNQELSLRSKSIHSEQAASLIANPRRAREAYAPDFSIVTLEREFLELGDLRGKVVVLDFWGTWCPPCVQAVPWLRGVQKRHAKDAFVMIGINSDNDERLLRDFLSKNQMEWPEHLDRDRTFQRSYDVRVWPTYVVIDDEGIVRFRATGTSPATSSRLEDEIRRHLKIAAARRKSN